MFTIKRKRERFGKMNDPKKAKRKLKKLNPKTEKSIPKPQKRLKKK
jgi:hypothetical protein